MKIVKGPRRKAAIAAVAGGAVVAATGAAWAFISFNSTATAEAGAATTSLPVVSAVSLDPALLPGAGLSKMKLSVENPNSFPVKVTAITRTGGYAGFPSCQTEHLFGPLANQNSAMDVSALNLQVPANSNQPVALEVPLALGLSESATATCGIKFQVRVTAQQQVASPAPTTTSTTTTPADPAPVGPGAAADGE